MLRIGLRQIADILIGVLSASLALILGCISLGADQGGKVVTKLTVSSNAPYVAKVTVENLGTQPASLLKWYFREDGVMPFELFVLEQNGKRVKYVGSFAKLPGTPSAEDYFIIKPGQKVFVQFSLQQFYNLAPGTYSAQYKVSHAQPGGGVIQTVSNAATFTVAGK